MNVKILGKAMGFMFLPTFGVLLVLLVGFFDPIAMWTFIKSDSGWAIFIRVVLLIAEIALVLIMYFRYLEKELKDKIINEGEGRKEKKTIYHNEDAYCLFPDRKSDTYFKFYKYETEDPNIIIVEREVKL